MLIESADFCAPKPAPLSQLTFITKSKRQSLLAGALRVFNGAMTMTKSTNHAPQSSIILFGLTSIGKPKAGTFKATEIAAARKAASKLGLHVLELVDESTRAFAAKVPAGRIHGHGEAIVPFVPKASMPQLRTWLDQIRQSQRSQVHRVSPSPRLPANWNDIKVGDRVLAQDTDPKDGWWQATVVDRSGDIFKLRWPRSERGRPFQKHRLALGLICPNEERRERRNGSEQITGWAAYALSGKLGSHQS